MKLESEYETVRAERDVALAEVERLNEEAASLASQLAAQVAANETLRAQYASSVRTYQDMRRMKTAEEVNATLRAEYEELRVDAARGTIPLREIPCGRTDEHDAHVWSDNGPDYLCDGPVSC